MAAPVSTPVFAIRDDDGVRLMVDEQYIDLPARTQCEQLIERSEKALVLQVEDGVATITPVPVGYKSMREES